MQGVRGEHKTPGEFRVSQNWIGGSCQAGCVSFLRKFYRWFFICKVMARILTHAGLCVRLGPQFQVQPSQKVIFVP